MTILRDRQELRLTSNGQAWIQTWHPPDQIPDGTVNGSAALCATGDGEALIVSPNGIDWYLPGGRPEPGEAWEQTMRREVREEACATVLDARLLGFGRIHCIDGPDSGRILVRSIWRADVAVDPWIPTFEMTERRIVPVDRVLSFLEQAYDPVHRRILFEAGL